MADYNFGFTQLKKRKTSAFNEILKMVKQRKQWFKDDLPKVEGDKFPDESDTFLCKCGMLMEFVVAGGDEGSGFTCNSCDNQLWCLIDETKTIDKYDKEYYVWEWT